MAQKRGALGRWLIYGLALIPVAAGLAYYWMEYVPSQREYFTNLRFRALAVAGEQVRTKTELLSSALEYAAIETGVETYVRGLLPDLDYGCGSTPDPKLIPSGGVRMDASRATVLRFYAGTICIAEAPFERLYAPFMAEPLFDDLLLADQNGRVIYQRSTSGARIAVLKELMAPREVKTQDQAPPRQGRGSDADMTTQVLLDGSLYEMLVQPLRITIPGSGNPDLDWVICGLVREARTSAESRHVAPKHLLWVFAPLLFLALSGPFLKLMLLRQTGRLGFRDVILLTSFTMCAAGFITLFLLSANYYWLGDDYVDRELSVFADKLDAGIGADLERMWRIMQAHDAIVTPSLASESHDRVDLLGAQSASLPPSLKKEDLDFDFVFWTAASGCQVAKWTTRQRTTGRVPQQRRPHFQDALARRFWTLPAAPGSAFTVQPVISPTTSEFIVVLSALSRHRGQKVTCGQESTLETVSIVASPHSLVRPLLPPQIGFAVIEPDGKALFHSVIERNLHENLFEEIRSPELLRARVATGTRGELSAYYRGLKYRFHVRPLETVQGSPWTLVVFRELEPRQAVVGLVWMESALLFLMLVGVLGLILAAASVAAGLAGWTWRRQVDRALSVIWPNPARAGAYRRTALWMGVLAAATLVAVGASAASSSGAALLLIAVAAPLAAFALIIYGTLAWGGAEPAGNYVPPYVTTLFLGLLLTGVVPMKALFLLCHEFEAGLETKGWQQSLAKHMAQRQQRLRSELETGGSRSPAARDFLLTHVLPKRMLDEHGYAAAFRNTRILVSQPAGSAVLPAWWERWLGGLRPAVLDQAMEAGALIDGKSRWKWSRGREGQLVLSGGAAGWSISSAAPRLDIPTGIPWWLSVVALLSCAYAWIHASIRRLYLIRFERIPLPSLADLPPPGECTVPLLVLGLPLARKDRSLRDWLGYQPPRINLYVEEFRTGWVEAAVERVQKELAAQRTAFMPERALAAGAGGGSGTVVEPAAPYHPWVHISNLEAKLDDPAQRSTVLELLERLLTMDSGGKRISLAMTSAVDPMFHFDSMLAEERKRTYDNPLPEMEVQRWARVLNNFRKVQPAPESGSPPAWAGTEWGRPVWEECSNHPALRAIAQEVVSCAREPLRPEAALARIEERALAFYKLIWSACTRPEKLVLVQLAQTGMVNPLATGTLQELVRKGVIVLAPQPRIMNETFRRFLETAEAPEMVREWEREAGESAWLVIRNVVAGLILIALLVLAATQNQTLQSATAVISAATAAFAGLFRAVEHFAARRQQPDAGQEA